MICKVPAAALLPSGILGCMNKQTPKIIATDKEVTDKINDIARQIIEEHPTSPLFVALLRGAAPFSARLMSDIVRQSPQYHPELDYMMVSTYGAGHHASEPHIVTDLAPSTAVNGRDVIVIDDVLDKGITADFVFAHLKARGARSVRLAVLCDKQVTRDKPIKADYRGFTFGDNWLIGMGMDDGKVSTEAYRWLDEIREVTN